MEDSKIYTFLYFIVMCLKVLSNYLLIYIRKDWSLVKGLSIYDVVGEYGGEDLYP